MLAALYAGLGIYAVRAWKTAEAPAKTDVRPGISIVLPFRNEEKKLQAFLSSLKKQDYPPDLFELVAVDDHSEDAGRTIIEEFAKKAAFPVKVLWLDEWEEGKKEALEKAIANSQKDIILSTDADTWRGPHWLSSMASALTPDTRMLIGPVSMQGGKFIQTFQKFEFDAFQFIGLGMAKKNRAIICNGTNLAYRRSSFDDVGGFGKFAELSSGDDIFLMLEMKKKFPGSVRCTSDREAMVITEACKDMGELIHQKVRWASKSVYVRDRDFMFTAFLATAVNAWAVLLPFLAWSSSTWTLLLISFLSVKFIYDLLMVSTLMRQRRESFNVLYFVISFILYPPYLMMILILSNLIKAHWKGRRISA